MRVRARMLRSDLRAFKKFKAHHLLQHQSDTPSYKGPASVIWGWWLKDQMRFTHPKKLRHSKQPGGRKIISLAPEDMFEITNIDDPYADSNLPSIHDPESVALHWLTRLPSELVQHGHTTWNNKKLNLRVGTGCSGGDYVIHAAGLNLSWLH